MTDWLSRRIARWRAPSDCRTGGQSFGLLSVEPPLLGQLPVPVGALDRIHSRNRSRSKKKGRSSAASSAEKTTAQVVKEFKEGRNRVSHHELLFKRYFARVVAFVTTHYRGTFSREDAEEIANDVFHSVWKGLDGLRNENKFEAFLLTITNWKCFARMKGRQGDKGPAKYGHLTVESVESRLVSRMLNPEQTRWLKELVERMRQILPDMPPQVRRCMKLFLDGYSIQEIAFLLRISPSAVRVNLHRAREYLREKLGAEVADVLRSLSENNEE